jgi:hypothetical protein
VLAQRSSQHRDRPVLLPGRSLGVADPRLHFPCAIGILDPARQGCDTVVSQNISEQRVDGGIVEVGLRYAFFQVVENDESWTTAQATKCFLVQFRPSAYTRPPGEQAHAFTAVAERQHEQPRPAMLATLRITHHRTTAVVDLRFFSGGCQDDPCGFRATRSAKLLNKAFHGLTPGPARSPCHCGRGPAPVRLSRGSPHRYFGWPVLPVLGVSTQADLPLLRLFLDRRSLSPYAHQWLAQCAVRTIRASLMQ